MGKQVKTPRFYVDIPTFLHATGDSHWDSGDKARALMYMNPSNPFIYTGESNWKFKIGDFDNKPKTSFPINFCALLNHNFATDVPFKIKGVHSTGIGDQQWPNLVSTGGGSPRYKNNILNGFASSNHLDPVYNGVSIFETRELNGYWNFFGLEWQDTPSTLDYSQLGSLVVGKYWDATNSPDLNLTMSRRFDGIKKQKTIGGKTLANIYYDGPTEWTMNSPDGTYKYPPFELDSPDSVPLLEYDSNNNPTNEDELKVEFNKRAKSGLGRKGLRSWNLTFSYISEDNMWMENEVSSTLESDNSINSNPNPMLYDNSFNFVWNCTLGGALPFIFQPNADQYDASGNLTQAGNNNPDQFSICTFRQNTLSVKQVAYNTYTLSITIDEVA